MSLPYEPGAPLTARELRELDVLAIEHVGIPGIVLMENAGRAVAKFVFDRLLHPPNEPTVILCGSGNNGGDGFVAARHLLNGGVPVQVLLANKRSQLHGDAETQLAILERMDHPAIEVVDPAAESIQSAVSRARVIIDGLLGTGSQGTPREPIASLIRAANANPAARRIAIDLPSGMVADTGEAHDPTFRADATVTLVAPKVGFTHPEAGAYLGHVHVGDIGVPRTIIPGRL